MHFLDSTRRSIRGKRGDHISYKPINVRSRPCAVPVLPLPDANRVHYPVRPNADFDDNRSFVRSLGFCGFRSGATAASDESAAAAILSKFYDASPMLAWRRVATGANGVGGRGRKVVK